METFGVDLGLIKRTVQGVSLDPAQFPPEAATEIIERNASMVVNEAAAVGIVSWEGDTALYAILQGMTLYACIAEIIASKNRGVEYATFYQKRYDALLGTLRARPQSVAPGAGTNKLGSGVVAVTASSFRNVDRLGLLRRIMY